MLRVTQGLLYLCVDTDSFLVARDSTVALFFRKMFFEKSKPTKIIEFQAIVLAGNGGSNRLYPLIEEDNVPKPLLPVANKPIISYVLDWLEKAGVTDVTIITQQLNNAHQKLSMYLSKQYDGGCHVNLRVIDDDIGTADALREIKDQIKHDFIVISCETITDLPPHTILDYHRVRDPTLTALFFELSKSEASAKEHENLEFVGVDTAKERLVYVSRKEEGAQDITLRMSLLWKFPRVTLHKNIQDSHLYIFKRWVIDLIVAKEQLSSIRRHVVPLLVKCQYQRKLVERENIISLCQPAPESQSLPLAYDLSTTDIYLTEEEKELVKCQIFVNRTSFCGRGNTINNYLELNRHFAKTTTQNRNPPTAEVSPRTQVGNDSLIGEYTRIDERCSVKRSTIGAHCNIGKNVKISNSVVMDHVTIEDGVKLEGCVVCIGAKILEKSDLKGCEVGGGYVVEKETVVKNEKLVGFRDLD